MRQLRATAELCPPDILTLATKITRLPPEAMNRTLWFIRWLHDNPSACQQEREEMMGRVLRGTHEPSELGGLPC